MAKSNKPKVGDKRNAKKAQNQTKLGEKKVTPKLVSKKQKPTKANTASQKKQAKKHAKPAAIVEKILPIEDKRPKKFRNIKSKAPKKKQVSQAFKDEDDEEM